MEKKPNTARIPKGKKRIMITLELEVIDKIEEVAEKNMRTLSNEIAMLIKEKYMRSKE